MNWRRGTDYYDEGDLLWLEVATIIHQRIQRTEIDRRFLPRLPRRPQQRPASQDLHLRSAREFAQRHRSIRLGQPSSANVSTPQRKKRPRAESRTADGRSSYNDKQPKLEGRRGNFGEVYSIGLQVGQDGTVSDSIVGSPAFEAGVSSQMKIIGVNGRVFTPELLNDAVKDAKDNSKPITLLVVVDDYYRTATINYHDGPRYPHLVREEGKPDYLDELIKPRAGQ